MQYGAAILLGQVVLAPIGGAGRAPVVDREIVAMGTRLRVAVESTSLADAHAAVDRVFDRVSAVEARLSTWSAESELSAVNTAAVGQPVRTSAELSRWLGAARSLERTTSGAFSLTAGSLVDAWDLRGSGRHPSPEEIRLALSQASPACFAHSTETATITRRCADAWIDAGAFGKGIALDEAAVVLVEAGVDAAVMDFGGQMLIVGTPADVGIAHPSDRDRTVATWNAVSGAIATTSQSERTLAHDDGPIGHVLDPFSGHPVPAWGSVTVRSTDGVTADALSTALFVMGPDQGVRWLAARPDISAVFLVHAPGRVVVCGTADAIEALTVTETEDVAISARTGPVVPCSLTELGPGER